MILLIVIIGYFIQRKIRQIELESNTMKCDIESHSDYVSNILNKQNQLIYEIINEDVPHNMTDELKESLKSSVQTIDFSKINDILKEDKDSLTKQRDNISHIDSDGESSADNDLQSDYDISSDNMSDHDSVSDCISLVEEALSDNSMSDIEDGGGEDDGDDDNIRVIHAVADVSPGNVISSNMPVDLTTKSIKLNIKKVNNSQQKRQYTRKTPTQAASTFETGHRLMSENDNTEYKVIETKNGHKRWLLCKY